MTAAGVTDPAQLDLGGPPDWPSEPFPDSVLNGSIPDRFEAIVRKYADRPAVEDLVRRLTYTELSALVERTAAAVAAAGAQPGPVAVLMRNDALFPAALLGVLTAGRCVLPLDADHPFERNRLIARHAGVTTVVSSGPLVEPARRLFAEASVVVDIDELGESTPVAGAKRPDPDDLAFLLYTSGSSGVPKGVCHSHRNALNDTLVATRTGGLGAEDRMSMFYSAVIGGIRNILGALLNGASLHVLPPLELGAAGLVREIRARRITTCLCVPTLLRRVVGALEPGERLDSVRLVRLAGDRVEWSDVELFRRAFAPDARLNVAIGSTECSSTYAHWYVEDGVRQGGARLPVGRPAPGLSLSLLDENRRPVADGEIGEFVVSGRYLALGYWREPELTAQAFSTDATDPGVRIFRTGDMGLRRPDGLLEFVGRKDQLIKLRGNRIEPGEVESALRGLTGVSDAAVVVRMGEGGRARAMAAYVELRRDVRGLLPRHLMAMLSRALPRYMLPAAIHITDSLPRLANFKLDRAALARLDAARDDGLAARAVDPLLDDVATAFEAILSVTGATPEDNLLSLGGDSLQAVDVMLELQHRTGVVVPSEAFAESQTIRDLAGWIAARRTGGEALSDVDVN